MNFVCNMIFINIVFFYIGETKQNLVELTDKMFTFE